jgi:type II secretory pathway component GspD/PulD (secretin)
MKPGRRLVNVVLGIVACAVLAPLGGPGVSGDEKKGAAPGGKVAEKRFTFQMQAAPWKKVFEWLTEQAGLPVVAEQVPTGSFTFVAPPVGKAARTFTLTEIIDLLNDALLVKKYLLVRRPHSLQLVPADEPFDAALAPLIAPDAVSAHGQTEIVRMMLPLTGVEAKDILPAIKSLQGPFGEARPVGTRLLVRDTVANLRQIINVVQEAGMAEPGHLRYVCKYIKAPDARRVLEELLGDPANGKSIRRPNVFFAIDERDNALLLSGPAQKIADAKAILAKIDVATSRPTIGPQPVLKIYRVTPGTAPVLARTLQEAYRNSHSVRIGNAGPDRLLVYAPPEQQLEIARQVSPAEPDRTSRTIAAIPLTILDAAPTMTTLRELLAPGGPTLVADTTRNAILVRGSKEQVDEVSAGLKALGEPGQAVGNVRVITIEGGNVPTLAEELQRTLQRMRNNPVRVIIPGRKGEQLPKPAPGGKGGPGAKKPAGKPVTLSAIGDKLIAASDDAEALALVQQLARLYQSPPSKGDLTVLPLKHGSAVEVARVLDEAFNGRAGTGKTSPRQERVRIVPDRASNALLVRATPLDLLVIREVLARTLDVPSDGGDAVRTYFLGPLRHARADEVVKVLRELYRQGGKPTLTVTVDPRTNTLILRGSAVLHEEARRLVERLDSPDAKKKEPKK